MVGITDSAIQVLTDSESIITGISGLDDFTITDGVTTFVPISFELITGNAVNFTFSGTPLLLAATWNTVPQIFTYEDGGDTAPASGAIVE